MALCRAKREILFSFNLTDQMHLVRFEPGRIEFRPTTDAPRDLAPRLARLLGEWTGRRWLVSVSNEPGEATLAVQERNAKERLIAEVAGHPLVKAVLETFPGAGIAGVRPAAEKTEYGEGDPMSCPYEDDPITEMEEDDPS